MSSEVKLFPVDNKLRKEVLNLVGNFSLPKDDTLKVIANAFHETFKKNVESIKKMRFNFLNTIEPVIPLLYELSTYVEKYKITDFSYAELNKLNKLLIKTANKHKKCSDSFTYYNDYYQKFMLKYEDKVEVLDKVYTFKRINEAESIPDTLINCIPMLLFDAMQTDYKLFQKLVDSIISSYKGSNEYLLFALGISLDFLEFTLSDDSTKEFVNIVATNAGITYISSVCIGTSGLDNDFKFKENLLSLLTESSNSKLAIDSLLDSSSIIKKSLDLIPDYIKNTSAQITKDLQNIKFSTMEHSYKNSINTLTEKIANQGMLLNERNNTIKILKSDIEKYESEISILKNKLSKLEEAATEYAAMTTQRELPKVIEPSEEECISTNQLGYIIKKGEEYHLRTSYGRDFLINHSNHTIFTLNQFALINPSGEIITNYNYLYNTPIGPNGNYEFVIINSRNGNLVGYSPCKDEYIELNFNSYKLGINQIVLINSDENKVETVYKRCHFTLDSYKEYVDTFLQNIYLIISKFGNSYIVRDIIKNEEIIKEYPDYSFNEQSIIFVYKDGYVKEITKINFYTNSSLYSSTSIVSAIILDNHIGYKDEGTGKLLYINNIPPNKTIYEGDNIKIDEFNNFICVLSTSALFESTSTKRKVTVRKEKPKFNKDLIKYNVALVGDIGLQNTYKTIGFKNRMNIDTYDGSLSYSKIRLDLKDYDLILIDPSCIEHNNMYSIRDNFDDVVFLKNNGASRVVDAVLRYFED